MPGDWLTSARAKRLTPWVLAALMLVVYLPSLRGGFLGYDDPWLIEHNRLLADPELHALRQIWLDLSRSTRLALGAEYLPLRDTLLWCEARLYGLHPLPLRVVNLGLYVGAVLWLRNALLISSLPRFTAEAAILLFAVHPLHVESVAWLAGRKDVLSLLFCCWALSSYAAATTRSRWQVPLLVTAGMLSKSTSVVLPLLLLTYDLLERRRPDVRALSYAAIGVTATMVVHLLVGSRVQMVAEPLGGSRWVAFCSMGPVWLRYWWSFVNPGALSIVHEVPLRPALDALAGLGYGALGAWALTGLGLLPRRPVTLFTWLWFVLPLLPTSQVLVPLQNAMADRYAMLSVLSFCVLVGVALNGLRPALAALSLGSLVVFYGAATWQRSALFADSAAVFADAAQKSSTSAIAEYQLGYSLEAKRDFVGAERAYRAALAGGPARSESQRRATNNLARIYVMTQRLGEAEALLERGRAAWPADEKVLRNLIKVVHRRGDDKRAQALYDELQRLPSSSTAEPDTGP